MYSKTSTSSPWTKRQDLNTLATYPSRKSFKGRNLSNPSPLPTDLVDRPSISKRKTFPIDRQEGSSSTPTTSGIDFAPDHGGTHVLQDFDFDSLEPSTKEHNSSTDLLGDFGLDFDSLEPSTKKTNGGRDELQDFDFDPLRLGPKQHKMIHVPIPDDNLSVS